MFISIIVFFGIKIYSLSCGLFVSSTMTYSGNCFVNHNKACVGDLLHDILIFLPLRRRYNVLSDVNTTSLPQYNDPIQRWSVIRYTLLFSTQIREEPLSGKPILLYGKALKASSINVRLRYTGNVSEYTFRD